MCSTDESETCALCGCETLGEGRLIVGRWLCKECVSGANPPTMMPPTEKGRRQIAAWLAPRTPRNQSEGLR